jgi:hypothetical protein
VTRWCWRRTARPFGGGARGRNRRPSHDGSDDSTEASDARIHSVRRNTSVRVLLHREGTAVRDRLPHQSVGAPAGPKGEATTRRHKVCPQFVLLCFNCRNLCKTKLGISARVHA